jgi:hypothetical protein
VARPRPGSERTRDKSVTTITLVKSIVWWDDARADGNRCL